MLERTREIKAVVVGSFFHGRQILASFENGVTRREDLGHHFALALLGDDVQKNTQKISVLAVELLRRSVRNQAMLFIPAEALNALRRFRRGLEILLRSLLVAIGGFQFGGFAKRHRQMQRERCGVSMHILQRVAVAQTGLPPDDVPPGPPPQPTAFLPTS